MATTRTFSLAGALCLLASCVEPYDGPILSMSDAAPRREVERDGGAAPSGNPADERDGGAAPSGNIDGPSPGESPDGPMATGAAGCPAGFHACGDRCAPDTDPDTCGVACEPCPSIQGGDRTCDGRKCGITCPAGSKPCLDACVPESAPCDNTCQPGQNLCGGLCVDRQSLSACGPACTPCPSSPNGTAACDGDRCELTCKAGTTAAATRV